MTDPLRERLTALVDHWYSVASDDCTTVEEMGVLHRCAEELSRVILAAAPDPAPAVTLDGRTAFSLWMEDRLDRSEWKYLPESGQQWWNRFAERLTAAITFPMVVGVTQTEWDALRTACAALWPYASELAVEQHGVVKTFLARCVVIK